MHALKQVTGLVLVYTYFIAKLRNFYLFILKQSLLQNFVKKTFELQLLLVHLVEIIYI